MYEFYFWQISSPEKNVSKFALISGFCVYSSAKDSLRSAKNVAFFLSLHFGCQADGESYTTGPHLSPTTLRIGQ